MSLLRVVKNSQASIKYAIPSRSIPVRHASPPTRNNGDLNGRVALVTGGTSGIGKCIARRLAVNGAQVVVSSRKQTNVDLAVEELRSDGLEVSGIACHIANKSQRRQMINDVVSSHGDLNILVQNAGVNPHPFDIMTTPESVIQKTCEIHIQSNFQIIQKLFPRMKNSIKPCSVVLTSSIAAKCLHLYPGIYGITKAGVVAMTRAFARDLMEHNVRINCVNIGPVDTDFMDEVYERTDIVDLWQRNVIVKRFGKPTVLAGIVAYLASDDASYITGENFNIAGGMYGGN